MMGFRDCLAGAAATALLGATPAFAQATRSLFEELPAPTIAPVTSDLRQPSQSLRPTVAPVPPTRPAVLARAVIEDTPAATKASTAPQLEAATAVTPPIGSQVTALPPPKPAFLRQRLASVDPAAVELPVAPAPAAPFSLFAPTQPAPAVAEAPAVPQKPMTRAEKRRAEREARKQAALQAAEPAPAATPTFATNPLQTLLGAAPAQNRGDALPALAGRGQIDAWVSYHAKLNHVPEALVHRIIVRESKYNPRAVGSGGAMGLMQIKTATARGVGYTGGPAGLLDAETNLTYGIKYLAGAWRVSGGSHDRAVSHYARGYYYEAKRQGRAGRGRGAEPTTTATAAPATPSFLSLFSPAASAHQ
jgi:soluble lytic murein transglycosylase-like protein